VHIEHFPTRRDESPETQTRRVVEHALSRHPGDVLVFLPGRREIARVQAALERSADVAGLADILALHGELPIEQQARALQPDSGGRRRVVLATNVAESSVTLPGVRTVIDSGLAREPHFDPNSGFSRLDIVAISQASANQRAGRAGRIADGWAYRLWPASQRLEAQRRPEIMQAELSGFALELAAWGSDALHFVDPPPKGALAAARDLLQRLGALDGPQRMTELGKQILHLGTHARLASLLLSARGDEQALACDLVALLEARDPLPGGGDALAARWRALAAFRRGDSSMHVNRSALSAIDSVAQQWRRRLHCDAAPPSTIEAHALGDLLVHAFPDRIAAQHPHDPRRYLLANGRSARIFEDSVLFGERWLVISDLRHEAKDALILRAAPTDEMRLREDFPDRFTETLVTRWDTENRALVCVRESRFDRIMLTCKPAGRPDAAQAARALTDAVRELGLEVLPWTESLQQWRARAQSLRHWAPELDLPDFSDPALIATLEGWLSPAFSGLARLDALSEERLTEALKSRLEWSQRQQIDRWVPTRIEVPSGMDRRIDYAIGPAGEPQSPVLAVKLQEMFGLADTPRIVDGRVPLTLHLLSPAGRPLQVTQDLRGFWERTYPEVKKEMKGRYPKHPWPDDPWTATATHRAKPRGT
jgi:ATP-dependent helicase HrpB